MKSKAEFAICQNVTSIMLLMPNTHPHCLSLSLSVTLAESGYAAISFCLQFMNAVKCLRANIDIIPLPHGCTRNYTNLCIFRALPPFPSLSLFLCVCMCAAIRMHPKLTLETFSLPRKSKTHLLFDILLFHYCRLRTIRFVAQLV